MTSHNPYVDALSAKLLCMNEECLSLTLQQARNYLQDYSTRYLEQGLRRAVLLATQLDLRHPPQLDLRRSLVKHSALLAFIFPIILHAICLLLCRSLYGGRNFALDSGRIHAPLSALLSFLTPTSSIWPTIYLSAAQKSLDQDSATLTLPLHDLVKDITAGAIELRNPTVDLPPFVLKTHHGQDWAITPSVNFSWRLYVVSRVILMKLACWNPLSVRYHPPVPRLGNLIRNPNYPVANAPPKLSKHMTMLVLDAIPYPQLAAYIRGLQVSLVPGDSAMLGFSTQGHSRSCWSDDFAYAALPFLGRRLVTKTSAARLGVPDSARCPSLDVKPTPLLTSLQYILKLLTSGTSRLSVDSVQNVSEEYASYLDRYVQDLTDMPKARGRLVAQWGLDGWREERLFVAWEAALFRAGVMSRWVVLVTRAE